MADESKPADHHTYPKQIAVQCTAMHYLLFALPVVIWSVYFYLYPHYARSEWPRF